MLPREDTKKNGLTGFSVVPAPEFYNFLNILIKNTIWGGSGLAGNRLLAFGPLARKRVLPYIGF
jgi:hypothetical protein